MLNALVPIASAELAWAMSWILARCDLPNIEGRLIEGRAGAYRVFGTDALVILAAGTAEDQISALWIESLGGAAGWRPKRNMSVLASVLQDCEEIARLSGCSEVRIEAGNRASLKSRIFPRFGFEAKQVGPNVVLRKVL